MLTIHTSLNNLHIFMSLTGHAFDESSNDWNRTHGFYWAMRWLARKVLGDSWMNMLTLDGKDDI